MMGMNTRPVSAIRLQRRDCACLKELYPTKENFAASSLLAVDTCLDSACLSFSPQIFLGTSHLGRVLRRRLRVLSIQRLGWMGFQISVTG
jgi:hypothetical protein